MNNYRLDKKGLWDILEVWDEYLPGAVRVVACGGTALTLQDLKASTKDVDFLVPDFEEYKTLLRTLQKLGYRQKTGFGWARDEGFTFDLFRGNKVFMTELLDCPLDAGRHIPIRQFKKLEVSALNDLDLIISKMFRGDEVDVQDCLMIIKGRAGGVDLEKLRERYAETALGDLNPEKMMRQLEYLMVELKDLN